MLERQAKSRKGCNLRTGARDWNVKPEWDENRGSRTLGEGGLQEEEAASSKALRQDHGSCDKGTSVHQ